MSTELTSGWTNLLKGFVGWTTKYISRCIYIYIYTNYVIYIYIPIHGYITNYGYHHVFGFPPRHIRIVLPIAIRHCQQHFLCNLRQNQNDVQGVPSAACP